MKIEANLINNQILELKELKKRIQSGSISEKDLEKIYYRTWRQSDILECFPTDDSRHCFFYEKNSDNNFSLLQDLAKKYNHLKLELGHIFYKNLVIPIIETDPVTGKVGAGVIDIAKKEYCPIFKPIYDKVSEAGCFSAITKNNKERTNMSIRDLVGTIHQIKIDGIYQDDYSIGKVKSSNKRARISLIYYENELIFSTVNGVEILSSEYFEKFINSLRIKDREIIELSQQFNDSFMEGNFQKKIK